MIDLTGLTVAGIFVYLILTFIWGVSSGRLFERIIMKRKANAAHQND